MSIFKRNSQDYEPDIDLTSAPAEVLRRDQVMTEAEIERADRYVDWLAASWTDKDNRGLFAKWAKVEKYWEGNSNLPDSDDSPGSNTNIVNANIEGQTALMTEKNPTVLVTPQEESDVQFAEIAQIMGQFIVDKNKMRTLLDTSVRRYKKFGMAIFTVMFDPDVLEGMGLPVIRSWNPAYVYFDPNITDPADIESSRYIAITCNKSIKWAKKKFGEERAGAIHPNYKPRENPDQFNEDAGDDTHNVKDNYLHMFMFTKTESGKLRIEQVSGCGVLLWDSEEHPDLAFPKDKYPFFVASDLPREGTVYAKGGAELLLEIQELINDLDDQIRINARLTGNIQKVIGTASGIDIDKWTNEPGLNIPANDPTQYQIVKPPEMPQYVQQRRNQALLSERQIVSRFSDQMTGIRQVGVDTATEALALQQSGRAGVDRDKMVLEEVLSEVVKYCLDLVSENWTTEQAFKITGKETEFIWFRADRLKKIPKLQSVDDSFTRKWKEKFPNMPVPDHMIKMGAGNNPIVKSATFDIHVNMGAGMPSNKAFRYNVVKEAYLSGAMDVREYREKLREFGILPLSSWEVEQRIIQKLEQMRQPAQPRGEAAGYGQPQQVPGSDIQGVRASGRPEDMRNLGGGTDDVLAQ